MLHFRGGDSSCDSACCKVTSKTKDGCLQVYLHAHSSLRDDMTDWIALVKQLVKSNPAGPRVVLNTILDAPQHQDDAAVADVEVVDVSVNSALEVLYSCDTVRP